MEPLNYENCQGLNQKTEVITALQEIIITMGTQDMIDAMVEKLSKIYKEG